MKPKIEEAKKKERMAKKKDYYAILGVSKKCYSRLNQESL